MGYEVSPDLIALRESERQTIEKKKGPAYYYKSVPVPAYIAEGTKNKGMAPKILAQTWDWQKSDFAKRGEKMGN